MSGRKQLQGPRAMIRLGDAEYPDNLTKVNEPPAELYVIGDIAALQPGLAVIGARKATPYGRSCARHFARRAAEKGVCIISGGARGCDSESHRAALGCGGPTVVFLGGGIDQYYPAVHGPLFQDVIDNGGAVVSEYPWDMPPLPYMFRARNRLIAGLAQAVLIVEAGLPSGTFSTADEALGMGKEVLVVPGAITSPSSRGSNHLIHEGATPIIDDESFDQALFDSLCVLQAEDTGDYWQGVSDPLLLAILAQPMGMEDLYELALNCFGGAEARARLNETIAQAEADHLIARQANGKWVPLMPAC